MGDFPAIVFDFCSLVLFWNIGFVSQWDANKTQVRHVQTWLAQQISYVCSTKKVTANIEMKSWKSVTYFPYIDNPILEHQM